MRVAALSDFHIGVSASRCGFRHDLPTFERYLDALEREHDAIVLLGDIFQTDHGIVPTAASAGRCLRLARARMHRLVDRFRDPRYVYVHGNHDAVAAEVLGAPLQVLFGGGDDGARILLTHGHQYDPVADRAPLAADAGTWVTGRLRACGLRTVATWLELRDIAIKDGRFAGPGGPYTAGAVSLARAQEAQIVIMGHTHCARIDRAPGVVHANSGTCSNGRFSHVSADSEQCTAAIGTFDPASSRLAPVCKKTTGRR